MEHFIVRENEIQSRDWIFENYFYITLSINTSQDKKNPLFSENAIFAMSVLSLSLP